MGAEYHHRLTEHFLHAVELGPVRRRAFLDRLRRREARLCAEVESLLRHEGAAPALLRSGPIDRRRAEVISAVDSIGPYRLCERIGEGGMGVVYRAEQSEPIRREVAVKLIRAGLETEHLQARFDAERHVLALMEHPNIARVLDAGTTEAGRPFVVMEYVRGEPITDFCDRRRLGLDERLRLFLEVCEAVHYAHQNAIIHRDLKPSNLLVAAKADGRPEPKIIDFGIAKALSPQRGSAPVTEFGQLVGTPAYMSPEQAAGDGSNPDIRSDVYSLGAVLYELLVGCPPLPLPEGARGNADEIRRVIREQEPLRPSSRARAPGDRSREVARRRGTEPPELSRRLRGDLDAIATKALAKELVHRYGSASELAADLKRHLTHEPILARPPAALYRLGKLARRHRTKTLVAATLIPVLLGSGLALLSQSRRVVRERDRAEEITELLVRSYDLPFFVPGWRDKPDAREVLRHSANRFERELADRPILQARMLQATANALHSLNEPAAALPILERVREQLHDRLGEDHPLTLQATTDLARVLLGLSRRGDAEAMFRAVLHHHLRALGPAQPDTARAMIDLAYLLRESRRDDEAAVLFERGLSILSREAPADDRETLVTAGMLAAVYLDLGRLDEAEEILRDAVPRMRDDFPEKGRGLYNLASIEARRGNVDAAIEQLRSVVERPFTLGFFADDNLRSLFRDPRFLEIVWRTRGYDGQIWERVLRRAATLVEQGGDAEPFYRYLLDLPGIERDSNHYDIEWSLAQMYERQGRYAEARPLVEERLARLRVELGPESAWVGITMWHLAQVQLGEGDTDRALATLDESIGFLEGRRQLGTKSWALYARARRAAILGDRQTALRILGEAVDAGLIDFDLVRRDLAFRPLADAPEFRSAVELMEYRSEPPILREAETASISATGRRGR